MGMILHIVDRDEWNASVPGGYYTPSSLGSDGFIHCSTIDQTVETANQFYAHRENLVLLCIDTEKSVAEVRFESPACEGDERTEMLFPHIYGSLNVSAVIDVVDFKTGRGNISATGDGTSLAPSPSYISSNSPLDNSE